jgi:phosphoglycolate phosphatase-like HAD superfamily hydrolase
MKASEFPAFVRSLPEADLPFGGLRGWLLQSESGQVLGHQGIAAFFCEVHGCDLDRSKAEVLGGIVASATDAAWVMVGDRETDFLAAGEVGIPSIGVRWGYGINEELDRASCIVSRPDQLLEAVENSAQPLLPCDRANQN